MKKISILIIGFAFLGILSCSPKYTLDYSYPQKPLELPKDHAAHYNYQMEWWYYTGHLTTEDGQELGYEVTFFKRITNEDKVPGCIIPMPAHWFKDVGMLGHFAVTDINNKKFTAKEINNFVSSSKADSDKYDINVNGWSVREENGKHILYAKMKGYQIALQLEPTKPAALNGPNGIVNKGGSNANYYYSFTNISTTGSITINGKTKKVTGKSWMDHEFGTMKLTHSQTGWDWFSIQLDNNCELMLYLVKDNQNLVAESGGTFVLPDGKTVWLKVSDIDIKNLAYWYSKKTDSNYPSSWEISIKSLNMKLLVNPAVAEQELNLKPIPYWEGAVKVNGTYNNSPVNGQGYIELVGYSKKHTFQNVNF